MGTWASRDRVVIQDLQSLCHCGSESSLLQDARMFVTMLPNLAANDNSDVVALLSRPTLNPKNPKP